MPSKKMLKMRKQIDWVRGCLLNKMMVIIKGNRLM